MSGTGRLSGGNGSSGASSLGKRPSLYKIAEWCRGRLRRATDNTRFRESRREITGRSKRQASENVITGLNVTRREPVQYSTPPVFVVQKC